MLYGTRRPKKPCFKHNMNIWQGQGSQWFLISFARAFGAYSLYLNHIILFVIWICTAFVTFQRYCSCITANVKIKVKSNIPHWKSGHQDYSRASKYFTLLARRASVNFDLSANTDDYLKDWLAPPALNFRGLYFISKIFVCELNLDIAGDIFDWGRW